MIKKGACVILLCLAAVLVLAVVLPMNAAADVKSETVFIEGGDTYSFTLQLKEDQRVYWEWDATSTSVETYPDLDFTIKDSKGNVLASVFSETDDVGNAFVSKGDTYTFSFSPEGNINLAYTITYEPITEDGWGCCSGVILIMAILAAAAVLLIARRRWGGRGL